MRAALVEDGKDPLGLDARDDQGLAGLGGGFHRIGQTVELIAERHRSVGLQRDRPVIRREIQLGMP
ncbi:hypothetical protein D3C78_1676580 [compost metagenome]